MMMPPSHEGIAGSGQDSPKADLVLMLAPGWLGSRASMVSVAHDEAEYFLYGDLAEAGAVCCADHQLPIAAAP
jgi:hypothetical protein